MPDFDLLKIQLENYICRLTLNRPPVNALNQNMIQQLSSTLDSVELQIKNGECRVLLIDADGYHFSAGADLKERQQIPEDRVEAVVDNIRNTFLRIERLPVPVVVAVQGTALGGGLELALAADLRIIADDAKVGLPETGLAIIPGAGGTQRLAKLIGYNKALYWIASGRIFSGLQAYDAGLAEFLIKKDELKDFTWDLVASLARNGPIAVQAAKKAMKEGLSLPIEKGLEIEKKYYKKTIFTEDRKEGILAFLEKRNPNYKGK